MPNDRLHETEYALRILVSRGEFHSGTYIDALGPYRCEGHGYTVRTRPFGQ